MGKIRRNVYVEESLWNRLPQYIDCSRSEWIEKQIYKQINCNNDIGELERKMNHLDQVMRDIKFEKDNLKSEYEMKIKQQKLNDKNFQLIEGAMGTIRLVHQNEGVIEETRIEYIANSKNINPRILIDKTINEGLKMIPK